MKKKLLAVLLMVMSVFLLVACSSKDDLSGEYYWINEYRNELMVTISDNASGTIDVDGVTYSITNVDTDKKQITVNAGSDYVVPYTYEDGILTLTEDSLYGSSSEASYYKKGSEACKEALKKNGYKEVGTYE